MLIGLPVFYHSRWITPFYFSNRHAHIPWTTTGIWEPIQNKPSTSGTGKAVLVLTCEGQVAVDWGSKVNIQRLFWEHVSFPVCRTVGGFSGSRVAVIILKYETQAAAARPDLALQFTPIKYLPYQQNKETPTITESEVNSARGRGGMFSEEF